MATWVASSEHCTPMATRGYATSVPVVAPMATLALVAGTCQGMALFEAAVGQRAPLVVSFRIVAPGAATTAALTRMSAATRS